MDGAHKIGTGVSAAGHAGLVVWVILGGWLFRAPAESVTFANVSLVSSEEFAALEAAASRAPRTEQLAPEAAVAPAAEESPETPPPARPEARPEQTPPAAETPPEPAPDAAPDLSALEAPPPPEVEQPPEPELLPPTPEDLPAISDQAGTRTEVTAADRVAPTPTPEPQPDAAPADTAVEEITPDPLAPPQEVVQDPQEAAAPPEAGDVIETEANREEEPEPVSAAPLASPRPPRARPAKPDPQPEPAAAEAREPATDQSAVDAALADALGGGSDTAEAEAPTGPPLTGGEKDALRVAVSNCWNVGSLSTDALRVTVTVEVQMAQDGKPDGGSIRMLTFEGGEEAAARQAFEAARRAIIICGAKGFNLPAEKYGQWKTIEMVFNPEKMRIR